ncbi:MAG: TonB-dependent receptor [Acidobacteriaceae bacterium]|nr:TonB-dependent receptor [Acidobacteriaceae bacterium]
MSSKVGRRAARLRAVFGARAFLATSLAAASLFAVLPRAEAVVIRGRLTNSMGRPVHGGQVQLMQNGKVAAHATTHQNGTFELRSAASGRFTLMGTSAGYFPGVVSEFYGGTTDVLKKDVVLGDMPTDQISVTATGLPTPLPQVTAPVELIDQSMLEGSLNLNDLMRQQPGVNVVQTGQGIAQTSLFVRGGPSDGNKVILDGIPVDDVGGSFDFGPFSSSAIQNVETYRGPDSVLYGTDAEASVVSFVTPRGTGTGKIPTLNYEGDGGNLHQVRNDVSLGGTLRRLDYYGAFSRYDTSNALPNDRAHMVTSAGNVGYTLLPRLNIRGTIRNTVAGQGLPGAYDFLGLTVLGKQQDHDLYAQGTVEYSALNTWHNLVRYGIARKGETAAYFGNVGTPVTFYAGTPYEYTSYYGNVVTIRGANGYTATGQSDIFNSNDFLTSNRDELYYQTDKQFTHHLAGLFAFRYENERGGDVVPAYADFWKTQRTNFEYTMQVQGDMWNRLFYSVGGAIEKNHLYGVAGTPRIGLAYFPGFGHFNRIKLRANFAKGVHEPALRDEFESLYRQLQDSGNTAAIAAYHVTPLGANRSRTYDLGLEQTFLKNQNLVFKLGYFHNMFDHQLDYIDPGTLSQIMGEPISSLGIYGAEANTLAYRAEGIEASLEFRPTSRWFLRGGYTYLDAVVVQSFSTDAAYNGLSATNPNLPGLPIGSTYPLVGARPFRRPPHTGYASVSYTRKRLDLSTTASMVSRSDDSTFLSYLDINGGNTLLLPNRNLDFGYVKWDMAGTYQTTNKLGVYVQMSNLLNNQHMGPIGYPSTPFTVRAGLKFRFSGQ